MRKVKCYLFWWLCKQLTNTLWVCRNIFIIRPTSGKITLRTYYLSLFGWVNSTCFIYDLVESRYPRSYIKSVNDELIDNQQTWLSFPIFWLWAYKLWVGRCLENKDWTHNLLTNTQQATPIIHGNIILVERDYCWRWQCLNECCEIV